MTIREIREGVGISRAEFSRRYNIPIRTLEEWEAGRRTPPAWVPELLQRVIKAEKDGAE